MSKGGRYLNQPQQPAKKSRWKKVLLIILAIILVVAIMIGAVAFYYFKTILGRRTKVETVRPTLPTETVASASATKATEHASEPETTEETEPDYGQSGKVINVLVVGQAARDGEEAKLSDTIILATINKETSTITLSSFLRDTYIQLATPYTDTRGVYHTCGKNRINTAYALGSSWGGAADAMMFLDQTITNNFGIEIDYNVEIDFDAFEMVIDLMGGIKLDMDADEVKYMNKYFTDLGEDYKAKFVEGSNLCDGWDSLVYARMRHSSNADNDYKRTNRQRVVIGKLLDKCKRRTIPQLTSIAKEVMPYLTTDMTDSEIAMLMVEIIPLLANLNMETQQIPAEGTMWSEHFEVGGVEGYGLAFHVEKNREILRAIAEADHQ